MLTEGYEMLDGFRDMYINYTNTHTVYIDINIQLQKNYTISIIELDKIVLESQEIH